jgi:hypothetical protein
VLARDPVVVAQLLDQRRNELASGGDLQHPLRARGRVEDRIRVLVRSRRGVAEERQRGMFRRDC